MVIFASPNPHFILAALTTASHLFSYSMAQDLGAKAIEPTASGQIGINPVDFIGTNTQYYSADATTTKWIGVDTVIVETITRTNDGVAMTITSTAAIAVSTTPPSEGGASGDLNFIITPSAKTKLEELFKTIEAVCGVPGPARIKSRQTPAGTCVADYMVENAAAESTMEELLSNGFIDGLGNLVDLLLVGAEDFVKTSAAKKVKVAGGLGVLAYALWKDSGGSAGGSIPDVVKIPAVNIAAGIPATTSTETEPFRIPPPVLTNMYHYFEPFETPKADAMADGLQNRFASLSSAAVIAASTVLPNACTCIQYVQADGSLGSFDCTNLGDGANCDVVTSTVANPAPTGPALTPDQPAPAICNMKKVPDVKDEPRASQFKFTKPFNRKAALLSVPKLCKDNPYLWDDHVVKNCASYQNYAFDGTKVNNGGQDRTLGDVSKILFSMRWDLEICPNDLWWKPDAGGKGDDFTTTPAAKYLADSAAYTDCVTGCESAVNQYNTSKDRETHPC
ncbi:hypothetical protein ONS96_003928 [Cadophora gregata f. sp. sojae]|nr:hypothetical protein ONS96_003928 [Cadophora gregata f. sp. sojae]